MTNDAWIEASVARWERPLIAYARRILSDDDDARDVVQETFLRLCRQPRRAVEHRLTEWLFTVVRHCAIDHLRKERPMSAIADQETASPTAAPPSARMEAQETSSGLLGALATLPRNQQDCIRLKFQQDLSYQQISNVTGLSVTNVGYLIHIGIKTLRERLATPTVSAAVAIPAGVQPMSTIKRDDPRLTAYALGELNAAQRVAITAALAEDPLLRAEVEQISAVSGDLMRDLAVDLKRTPMLTKAQRAAIVPARRSRVWRVVAWSAISSAAAAAIALVVLPPIGVVREMDSRSLAMAQVTTEEPVAIPAPAAAVVAAPVEITEDEALQARTKSSEVVEIAVLDMKELEAPGHTDAVSSVETGSTGAFMSIGPRGGAQMRSTKRRTTEPPALEERTASEEVTALDEQAAFPRPPEPTAGMFGSRVGAAPKASPAPSKDAGFEFRDEAKPNTTPAPGETYNQRADHVFRSSRAEPLSTFGLDVDTASYGNVRRLIEGGRLPPRDAVRVEELVNYFPYDIPQPQDGEVFGVTVEVAPCPWQPAHRLARIAVRGKALAADTRQPLNLVFLVDVSGSMKPDNRLPLIKTGLSLLATNLTAQDQVAIVTYAGAAGLALPATSGSEQRTILRAVDALTADGGTNGGSGIQLAYQAAQSSFIAGGVNRVILCTDGDFNVGVTNRDELVRLVQTRAKQGVFLTVLGVGQDNLKDATMELLADKANGHYHYLDTIAEARKVLVEQMSGTLVTIAKDAKAQVEFNPARIAEWRQLGYEKRQLANSDFNNDRKDAGEIGAGHLVTMLYELVPLGVTGGVSGLRYQPEPAPAPPVIAAHADEWLTVKLRYKAPDGDTSRLVQGTVTDSQVRQAPSVDQRFAAAVAAFAMRLRGADEMGLDFATIASEARAALGSDPQGYRREFIQLVEQAAALERGAQPSQRQRE